jgi:hypothetical protein
MNKPTKKRNYYNEEILKELEKKFGYSIDYIRKSLRGDRTGIMPDNIRKEYKTLEITAKNAIQLKLNSKE